MKYQHFDTHNQTHTQREQKSSYPKILKPTDQTHLARLENDCVSLNIQHQVKTKAISGRNTINGNTIKGLFMPHIAFR